MKRPVESQQRKMRMIFLRIEGSTGTPSLEGPSKLECSIADTSEGVYTITFDKAFKQAPIVIACSEDSDTVVSVSSTTTACIISSVDLDETAAVSDSDIHVYICGSDDTSFYA